MHFIGFLLFIQWSLKKSVLSGYKKTFYQHLLKNTHLFYPFYNDKRVCHACGSIDECICHMNLKSEICVHELQINGQANTFGSVLLIN